jgi:hypothetical protein
MPNSILGHLNLLKLRGSKSVKIDGEEGVFIPYKKVGTGVTKMETEKGIQANLRVVIVQYKDKFGNDFMAIRAKTAWEFKHKKATEIFGNFTFTSGSIIELEPNEEYGPEIINYLGEHGNNEEQEVEL